jgi:hypothetical protein
MKSVEILSGSTGSQYQPVVDRRGSEAANEKGLQAKLICDIGMSQRGSKAWNTEAEESTLL